MIIKRQNIIHKLVTSVSLSLEVNYKESNIPYAGAVEIRVSIIAFQTRRHYKRDVSLVGVAEVHCTGILQYQRCIHAYVFQETFPLQDSKL
jgi:hypothetical protein